MFKIKKSVIPALFLTAGLAHNANALKIGTDDFYGHMHVYGGLTYANYADGIIKDAEDATDGVFGPNGLGGQIGAGFNVYYKMNDLINPFVGINFEGKYVAPVSYGSLIKVSEYFSNTYRFGTRINAFKSVKFDPYFLVGWSTFGVNIDIDIAHTSISKTKIATNVGAGLSTLFGKHFIIGVEYKYVMANFGNMKVLQEDPADGVATQKAKINAHQIALNFGAQFL